MRRERQVSQSVLLDFKLGKTESKVHYIVAHGKLTNVSQVNNSGLVHNFNTMFLFPYRQFNLIVSHMVSF